jgi:hypothetical protein
MRKCAFSRNGNPIEQKRVASRRRRSRPAILPRLRWRMRGSGSPLRRLAGAETYGEEKVRFVACGLLLMARASSARAGERYVEMWNPPEARSSTQQNKTASRALKHKRPTSHLVKAKTYSSSATTKLAARPRSTHDRSRHMAPDMSDIPRLITPEGNVLRVDAHDSHVEVAR